MTESVATHEPMMDTLDHEEKGAFAKFLPHHRKKEVPDTAAKADPFKSLVNSFSNDTRKENNGKGTKKAKENKKETSEEKEHSPFLGPTLDIHLIRSPSSSSASTSRHATPPYSSSPAPQREKDRYGKSWPNAREKVSGGSGGGVIMQEASLLDSVSPFHSSKDRSKEKAEGESASGASIIKGMSKLFDRFPTAKHTASLSLSSLRESHDVRSYTSNGPEFLPADMLEVSASSSSSSDSSSSASSSSGMALSRPGRGGAGGGTGSSPTRTSSSGLFSLSLSRTERLFTKAEVQEASHRLFLFCQAHPKSFRRKELLPFLEQGADVYYGAQEGSAHLPIVYDLARRGDLEAIKACVEQRVRPILTCSGPPAPFSCLVLSESDAEDRRTSHTIDPAAHTMRPATKDVEGSGAPKEGQSLGAWKKRMTPLKKGEREEKAFPGSRLPSSSPPNASPLLRPSMANQVSASSSPLPYAPQAGEEELTGHEMESSVDPSLIPVFEIRAKTENWHGGDEDGSTTQNVASSSLLSSTPYALSVPPPPPTSMLEALLQCPDRIKMRSVIEWVVKRFQSQTKEMERQALKKEKKWEKAAKKKEEAAKREKEETKRAEKQKKIKKEQDARHQMKEDGEEEENESSKTTKKKKSKKKSEALEAEHEKKSKKKSSKNEKGKSQHHHDPKEDPWDEALQSEKAETKEKEKESEKGAAQKNVEGTSPLLVRGGATNATEEEPHATAPSDHLRTGETGASTSETRHVGFVHKRIKKKIEKRMRKKKPSHATIEAALIHVDWLAEDEKGMNFLNKAAEYHRLSDVWPVVKKLAEFREKKGSEDGDPRIVLQSVDSTDWKKLGKGDQKRFRPLNIFGELKEKKAFHFFPFSSSK